MTAPTQAFFNLTSGSSWKASEPVQNLEPHIAIVRLTYANEKEAGANSREAPDTTQRDTIYHNTLPTVKSVRWMQVG